MITLCSAKPFVSRTVNLQKCLTKNQKDLKHAIFSSRTLTLVEGPAGTGKTMLSCEYAVKLIQEEDNKYERLIVTRPLVGVNQEQIGYLPGSMLEKTAPWTDVIQNYTPENNFEFIPLTFIRGHTWDNSIIIADEMQNSTCEQMKTLLTRVGYNTKLIINGDSNQSDLDVTNNGLVDLKHRLADIEYFSRVDFDLIQLTSEDIKRSPFVKFIYELYI